MIKINSISKSFYKKNWGNFFKSLKNKEIKVINEISFELNESDIILLHGNNGSGKTTLLRIIAGLIIPDHGYINYQNLTNQDVMLVSNNDRSFFWRVSVKENLKYFLAYYDSRDGYNLIQDFCKKFSITHLLDKKFMDLSLGQKKLFMFLRALLANPKVLLLDETLSSLDIQKKSMLLQYISELINEKKILSVLFVSHHTNEIKKYANKIYMLKKGKLENEF